MPLKTRKKKSDKFRKKITLKTRKKKSDKFRKKIKRKITAKGRASKFNYYISRLPTCPICREILPDDENDIIPQRQNDYTTQINREINNIIPQPQNSLVNDITTQISPPNLRILREQNRMNMREEIDQLRQRLQNTNINPSFVRIPSVRFQREPPQRPPSPNRSNSNNGDPASDGSGKKTRKRKRRKRRIN